MSIVLPRRKKHTDIFAPSKAIQDAKAKIGPAFFDVTLMECSRNAVELTKLVHQWEELDRAKLKIIKDISHEQEVLLRSLKKNKIQGQKDRKNTLTNSEKTPGFRFKSNGDLKKSSKSTPILHYEDMKDDDKDTEEIKNRYPSKSNVGNVKSRSKSASDPSKNYEHVNYENEIHELENVIRDIYTDLIKNNVSISSSASGNKVKTFLRAHSHEYVPLPDLSEINLADIAKPNDRFAFKPGSSNTREKYLHKSAVKSPSHRSCIGCQIRLRQEYNDLAKIISHSDNLSKRRWCYVPHGKYVQSTIALHGTPSVAERKSESSLSGKSSKTMTKSAKSAVQFATEKDNITARRAVSTTAPKSGSPVSRKISSLGTRPKSCAILNSAKSGTNSEPELEISKSINVLGVNTGLDEDRGMSSALSCKSARASSAKINAHFVDHASRMNLLKTKQIEEEKQCEKKISDFLLKIGSTK